MRKYLKILRECPLFRGIGEDEIVTMLGCLEAKTAWYGKNEMIFREGESAKEIGILLSGEIQMIREDYYGNRSIIARAEPGELFGESFACAGIACLPVSVIATEASEIMLIDCRRITKLCSHACEFHMQMIFNLLNVVAVKNLLFHQKLEITSRRTTREKLMVYLMMQAKQHGSSHFVIPYDRQELADYLEVDRSGLSAEISRLRREGVLACRKNEFMLQKGGDDE